MKRPDPRRPADLLPESILSRALPDPRTEPTLEGGAARVAAILGISRRHAYACIESGEIPSVRVGSRIVIPTAKFLAKFHLVDERANADAA